ncbi:MAG TPA: LysR substrate-binding domain-containing protein [Kofleriaceae bacterium]|jgi:DNA-binding transcriptional LysR family regulator
MHDHGAKSHDDADAAGFAWDDARHFAALAAAGSLSAAAKALGVDHVTVARRVRALEAALGLALVDRRARVPVLTADGERIAALVEEMAQAADGVARAASSASPAIAGTVSVSAPPTLLTALVAPGLADFRARYPALRLRLSGDKRVASLARREADVALRLVRPTSGDLVAQRVGRFAFGLYGERGYVARHPAAAHEFIAFDAASEHLPQHAWLLAHAGARPIAIRTNDFDSQIAAARAGAGIAALPDYAARREPSLVAVRTRQKPLVRDLWLVVHADLRAAARIRAVMAYLVACTAELRATRRS